ncbi:hypothetical protein SAMN06269250_4643 [Spirosoma fluviale]|uniref:Uncharacterized protein n=1 Tax=Spirosoma fluviale TaxID=1597977 RepID=A0A286GH10_9BACT|nr:hypothetical protein SAMN06269250_4643 [Spirosoma fluviale]
MKGCFEAVIPIVPVGRVSNRFSPDRDGRYYSLETSIFDKNKKFK